MMSSPRLLSSILKGSPWTRSAGSKIITIFNKASYHREYRPPSDDFASTRRRQNRRFDDDEEGGPQFDWRTSTHEEKYKN